MPRERHQQCELPGGARSRLRFLGVADARENGDRQGADPDSAEVGMVYGFDPDKKGEKVWEYRSSPGGGMGGQWGGAADDRQAYFSVNGTAGKTPGRHRAVRLDTGAEVWSKKRLSGCAAPSAAAVPAQGAAVTAVPGIVLSGSMDGGLRAYASDDGTLVWSFDTNSEFETVNGVKAKGGAMDGPGAAVGDGMIFINSGYVSLIGGPATCCSRLESIKRSRSMNGSVATAVGSEAKAGERFPCAARGWRLSGALIFIVVAALPYYVRFDEGQFRQYWPMRGWLLTHISMGCGGAADGAGAAVAGTERSLSRAAQEPGARLHGGGRAGRDPPATISPSTRLAASCSVPASSDSPPPGSTTTGLAFLAIKRHLYEQHKEWMVRSYVVTFAFVTFRAFDSVLAAQGMPLLERIGISAWFCWSVPLLLNEVVLQGRKILRVNLD
jgi:hypothetical protein